MNIEKRGTDIQELAQDSQLGLGVLLNRYNFTEHQHQTRPPCDQDGSREKLTIMSEHRQNISIV